MKSYCTQNNGDCQTCALANYGRDCQNNPITTDAPREDDYRCPICGSDKTYSTDEGENRGAPFNVGDCYIERWTCSNCGGNFETEYEVTQ